MKFWEKVLCGHKWKVHDDQSGQIIKHQFDPPIVSDFHRQTLICELCGKIRKIEL